jgi:hypothetical protein
LVLATREGHIRRVEDGEDKGMIDSIGSSVMAGRVRSGGGDLRATRSGGLMSLEEGVAVELGLSLEGWTVIRVLSSMSGVLSWHVWCIMLDILC